MTLFLRETCKQSLPTFCVIGRRLKKVYYCLITGGVNEFTVKSL